MWWLLWLPLIATGWLLVGLFFCWFYVEVWSTTRDDRGNVITRCSTKRWLRFVLTFLGPLNPPALILNAARFVLWKAASGISRNAWSYVSEGMKKGS